MTGSMCQITKPKSKQVTTEVKHNWEPTDNQGYEMQCTQCGKEISIFGDVNEDGKTEWDMEIDAECPVVPSMKFVLNGCDISFIAEAPKDITLEQLIKQCDKIRPDWCACGICSLKAARYSGDTESEIIIGYDSIAKANDDVSCTIRE